MDEKNGEFEALKKVFCIEKRSEPISYEEFSSIGMSKVGYLAYIAHCDRLRSAIMLSYSAHFEISSSKIKAEKDSIDRICQTCFSELLSILQSFCDDDINLADLAQENIAIAGLFYGICYSGSTDYLRHIDKESPALLYVDFDSFRMHIEAILYKLINRKFPIISYVMDPPIENLPLNVLKIKAEQKHDYEWYDLEPEFPVNSGNSSDIFAWAEKAERYYGHQCFIQEYEDVEDIIAFKEESIFDVHKHTLFIFKGNLSCRTNQHILESTKAIIELPYAYGQRAELDAFYCHECKKFFISETSYELYRKDYGFLPVCFAYAGESEPSSNYKSRAEKSPLMLCGYSVSQNNGLSKEKRWQLLSWILKNNIHGLGKLEIISHLEMLIETNGDIPRNALAKEKWIEDLQFVHNYGIDNQQNAYIQRVTHHNRKV